MGGNQMSAEELPTPRTDEKLSGLNNSATRPRIEPTDAFVEFARQLERELAQAKAELSALSRASGEAVELARLRSWKDAVLGAIKAVPEYQSGEWSGDKEGWGFCFEVVHWMRRELAKYQAAPTAPGMCLDALLSSAENVAATGGSATHVVELIRAAAKGRAAT